MSNRIDRLIESISAEVEDLPELAEQWDELDDDQRYAASYDWDLVVMGGYLVYLQERREAGELSAEQEERYRQLKADLQAAIPIIEQLGVRLPSEILD